MFTNHQMFMFFGSVTIISILLSAYQELGIKISTGDVLASSSTQSLTAIIQTKTAGAEF